MKSLTRNGLTSLFGYNQQDLRTSQTVNGTQTAYLLDGESVVEEKSSGTTTDLLQGPGLDNLLERGGVWTAPGSLGNTAITLDGSGNRLQFYFYAPFGQPYQLTEREAGEKLRSYNNVNDNWRQ